MRWGGGGGCGCTPVGGGFGARKAFGRTACGALNTFWSGFAFSLPSFDVVFLRDSFLMLLSLIPVSCNSSKTTSTLSSLDSIRIVTGSCISLDSDCFINFIDSRLLLCFISFDSKFFLLSTTMFFQAPT